MSPTARTNIHSLLRLGRLWNFVWRQSGGQGQGWPRGGGSRTDCIWRGCGRRIRRWNIRSGGEDRQERERGGLSWWEDNIAHVTLGTDPNAPLAYAPGLELHHPIMSMLGEYRGRLERER